MNPNLLLQWMGRREQIPPQLLWGWHGCSRVQGVGIYTEECGQRTTRPSLMPAVTCRWPLLRTLAPALGY